MLCVREMFFIKISNSSLILCRTFLLKPIRTGDLTRSFYTGKVIQLTNFIIVATCIGEYSVVKKIVKSSPYAQYLV